METQNMQQMPINPLTGHFRQPKISLTLPSGGKWWGDGALDLPANGELPIYAMTAKDEIQLRTPDSLLNGTSLVNVIQSCCPCIKDAWQMPSVDVDAILIAIRIASFGDSMDVNTSCPKCQEEATFGVPLGKKLAEIQIGDYDQEIEYQDLKFKLIPQQYYNVNRLNQVRFQEERISMLIVDATMPEDEKGKQLQESFQRLVDLGLENVTESTEYVQMADGTKVRNKHHILEFFTNSPGSAMKVVNDRLNKLAEASRPAPLKLKCKHCETVYENSLEFDYTSFFDQASSS